VFLLSVHRLLEIVLNISLVDRLNKNPCEVIKTGEYVEADASK
jgi:hypothetical protein